MEFEFNSNDKRKIHDINYTAKAGPEKGGGAIERSMNRYKILEC